MRTWVFQVFLLAWAVRMGSKVSVMIKGMDVFLNDCQGPGPALCLIQFSSVQSLTHSCLTLCNPMDFRMPGFPVPHQLPELAQTHVH